MGNTDSKADKSAGPRLSSEQEERVCQILNAHNPASASAITPAQILAVWSDMLTETMAEKFVSFVFAGERTVSFRKFVSAYASLALGTNSESATGLVALVAGSEATGSISFGQFVEFVGELWCSYLKILAHSKIREYRLWTKAGAPHSPEDRSALARYMTSGLRHSEGKLTPGHIEDWLYGSTVFKRLLDSVLESLYNVRSLHESRGLFPEPVYPVGFRCELLRLWHVFAVNSMLPREGTEKWRMLFSLRSHGESWSTLLKSIMFQGPTVIFIEDESGSIFGAFASASWDCKSHFYGDENCFLFTLSPEIAKFETTGYNTNFQYLNSGQTSIPNGLGMGGQLNYWGLYLDSEFGSGKVSKSCTTFRDYRKLTGGPDLGFRIARMEVWSCGRPDPTPEELGERTTNKGGVFNADPAAEAMLEMVGKTIHSKGLRPEPELQDED